MESKNGAVIRKHIGYGYIDASHADRINDFYQDYLNPYLNYHRPCGQADVKIDEKGRKRVSYKRYQTPLETLSLLDKPGQYLRQGLSMNALKRVAAARSDTDAARRMQQAKAKLFEKLRLFPALKLYPVKAQFFKQLAFCLLHAARRLCIAEGAGDAPQGVDAKPLAQVLCRLIQRQQGLQRSLITLVTNAFAALLIDLDIGLGARAMVVQIRDSDTPDRSC